MMLTQLATVARRTGFPVVEVTGWRTRTRPEGMLGVRTVTIHHTGNVARTKRLKVSLNTIINGKSKLPGPLSQIYIDIDGTIYIVAAGKANHAGESLKTDYTNPYAVGFECEASGDWWSEDWPGIQLRAMVAMAGETIKEFGLSISDVMGHLETCSPPGRKPDPRGFTMNWFRAQVKAYLEDDDVALTDADKKWLQSEMDKRFNAVGSVWEETVPYENADKVTVTQPFRVLMTTALRNTQRLLKRKESGLFIRRPGTGPVWHVADGYRVWLSGDDFYGAGNPRVVEVPEDHPLWNLPTLGEVPEGETIPVPPAPAGMPMSELP